MPGNTWDDVGLPKDMSGKSFVDFGCWEGDFCKLAITKGARRVLGIDQCACDSLKRNIQKHKFDFVQMDMMSESFFNLPNFDVVSFCGVLYHLQNPLSAIFRLRSMTKELLVVETLCLEEDGKAPIMAFRPHDPPSQWWIPNKACVVGMLEAAGFAPRVVWKRGHRLCVHGKPRTHVPYTKIAPRIPGRMELAGGERA